LFHNSNVFGSCIIHILYTVCAKIKKKKFRREKVNPLNLENNDPQSVQCSFISVAALLCFKVLKILPARPSNEKIIETKMTMEHWWSGNDNDNDKEIWECRIKNRYQRHFAQHRPPVYRPGIEPESPW
jgi:hypothetical protein